MGGRGLLIVLIGLIVVSGIVFLNINRASSDITGNSENYFLRQTAQNIAQGGVNLGLRQLQQDPNWRSGFALMNMFGGKVTVTVFDTTYNSRPSVGVRSRGVAGYLTKEEVTQISTAFVAKSSGDVKITLTATVTARAPVRLLGNYTIDGRDHTISGTPTARTGVAAIRTSNGEFTLSGSSEAGGTAENVDYVPSNPASPKVIKTSAKSETVFATPEQVLGGESKGIVPGILKALAISGRNGSQYVTDPDHLQFPLSGVTYVELASGDTWNSAKVNGAGLLIVHNNSTNAIVRNINNGVFKGLMIVDDIDKMKNDVLGGLVILTNNPSSGAVIGTGNGNLRYSRPVLDDLEKTLNEMLSADAVGGGSEAAVVDWLE